MIKIKKENLIGLKFNMLTVIADAEDKVFKSGKREPAVLCRCDCGAETVVVKSSLKNGATKSCGCLNKKNDYIQFICYMLITCQDSILE